MEMLLAATLALVSVAAAVGWAQRGEERARAQRLADEVHALRRASSGQRMVEDETTGSAPALAPAATTPEAEAVGAVADERISEARRMVAEVLEALVAAEEHREGARVPVETLRDESLALLARLERVELSLAPLAERCGALAIALAPPSFEHLPAAPSPFDLAPVEAGLRATEELSDTAARLRDDLSGLARSTDRVREATATSSDATAAVARGAEAIAPLAGALSGVANRVNLLALNLGVLVVPDAGHANVEEAGAELRSIFEEARRLAREVGTVGQRLSAAARAAAERGAALTATIAEERGRMERGLTGLLALDDLAVRLRTALESDRRAARECDEARGVSHAAAAVALAQSEAYAGEVAADRRAVAAFTSELAAAIASVTEARIAAERAVRNLLAVAEASNDRRSVGPESAALASLREVLRLLRSPTA